MIRSGQYIVVTFTTDNSDDIPIAPDTAPIMTLLVGGTAYSTSITVVNIDTGLFYAYLTLPSPLYLFQTCELVVTYSISSVVHVKKIWRDVVEIYEGAIPDAAAGTDTGLVRCSTNTYTIFDKLDVTNDFTVGGDFIVNNETRFGALTVVGGFWVHAGVHFIGGVGAPGLWIESTGIHPPLEIMAYGTNTAAVFLTCPGGGPAFITSAPIEIQGLLKISRSTDTPVQISTQPGVPCISLNNGSGAIAGHLLGMVEYAQLKCGQIALPGDNTIKFQDGPAEDGALVGSLLLPTLTLLVTPKANGRVVIAYKGGSDMTATIRGTWTKAHMDTSGSNTGKIPNNRPIAVMQWNDTAVTMVEDDGAGGYQFTEAALENAPTGGGGGGTGTGARTVKITVTDGTNPIESSSVRMSKGGESYVGQTDVDGNITFNLDDGTWTVSITAPGFLFSGALLPVDGDEGVIYQMVEVNLMPSEIGKTTGYSVTFDKEGNEVAGKVVYATITDVDVSLVGAVFSGETRSATSDVNGLLQFTNLFKGVTYAFRGGAGTVFYDHKIPLDAGPTYELPAFTANPQETP